MNLIHSPLSVSCYGNIDWIIDSLYIFVEKYAFPRIIDLVHVSLIHSIIYRSSKFNKIPEITTIIIIAFTYGIVTEISVI